MAEDTDQANGASEEVDVSRLFRQEVIESKIDLRVDVANKAFRSVAGDESVSVARRKVHARGPYHIARGSRRRQIAGDHDDHVGHSDMYMIGNSIEERVEGGVELKSAVESETIMAGAYVNTIAGAFMRLTAWADFLAWGAWAEADAVRTEIAGAMIRAHMVYAHACGVRILMANQMFDSYVNRSEIGNWIDNFTTRVETGGPGGRTIMES